MHAYVDEDTIAEQFVHRPFTLTPTHQALATVLVTAVTAKLPVVSISGATGVGKSTAVWYLLRELQRVNPRGSWVRLVADGDMTPEQCLASLETATHHMIPRAVWPTLAERFSMLHLARRFTCLVIDEAESLPAATLTWLSTIAVQFQMVVGLVSTVPVTAYPQYQEGLILHQEFAYPPVSVTDMQTWYLPQLGTCGWFLSSREPAYAALAQQVAQAAQGSLRRLLQILFYARWLALREQHASLTAHHLHQTLAILHESRRQVLCANLAL